MHQRTAFEVLKAFTVKSCTCMRCFTIPWNEEKQKFHAEVVNLATVFVFGAVATSSNWVIQLL